MYPEYVMNHAYEDTDVFVSLAKLKQHADCGVAGQRTAVNLAGVEAQELARGISVALYCSFAVPRSRSSVSEAISSSASPTTT